MIIFNPFVTSNKPERKPMEKSILFMPNKLNIGKKIFPITMSILLSCKIERITLNRTTKPPIKRIVFMEFSIDFDNSSPKSENEMLLLFKFNLL